MSVGNYINALADLQEKEVLELTKKRLEAGEDPLKILEDITKGMDIVGKRYEQGRYFIMDLMMAGEILKEVMSLIQPKLKGGKEPKIFGKVVMGTVEGDIHDIGKNIVISMLEANGFEVIDLGVDVPAEKFVEAIKKHQPQVVGMSALLTSAIDSMKKTVEAINKVGYRNKVKIMIGGGTLNEDIKEYVGADAYGSDPLVAVNLAKKWVKGE